MNSQAPLDPTPNPYQTPTAVDSELDLRSATQVVFQSNTQLRRHAINRYLLHYLPKRLFFGSLLMMFLSFFGFVAATRYVGALAVIPTMIGSMIMCSAIYEALVYRTRKRILERLQSYGLLTDETMTLHSNMETVQLVNAAGTHEWPNDDLTMFRTRLGWLICVEPLVFLFVPKQPV